MKFQLLTWWLGVINQTYYSLGIIDDESVLICENISVPKGGHYEKHRWRILPIFYYVMESLFYMLCMSDGYKFSMEAIKN